MAAFICLTPFVLFISATSQNHLGPYNDKQELFVYRQQIYAAHQLLQQECPELIRMKRDVYRGITTSLHIEIAKIVYGKMLATLKDCRANETTTEFVPQSSLAQPTAILPPTPRDCQELYHQGVRQPGVYLINPLLSEIDPFNVWCDFNGGHGWTVFQKRFNGSVDFYRNWAEYKAGFGSVAGEHWLGLAKIYTLTRSNQLLNILIKASNGTARSGLWNTFYLSDEEDNYRLMVDNSGYQGGLNSLCLSVHNGMAFSTKDVDNDIANYNCAVASHGAWWYRSCQYSNLNGGYHRNSSSGVHWAGFSSQLTETVMRVSRN